MPYMVELLLAYVDEVFSYLSVALGNQLEKIEHLNDSEGDSVSVTSEIKEQYTRVCGVAVEFCVHIKRADILFEQILSRFESVQQKETYLELLEPYILKDVHPDKLRKSGNFTTAELLSKYKSVRPQRLPRYLGIPSNMLPERSR